MDWLQDNLAVLSGALVPLLVVILKPIMEREAGGARLRRIKRYAQLRSALPDEGAATVKLDDLLAYEVEHLASATKQRLDRKLDGGTVAAVVCVSLLGGLFSFGLVVWAQASDGAWAVILWILFSLWTAFVLLFVLVGGVPNLYKKTEPKLSSWNGYCLVQVSD